MPDTRSRRGRIVADASRLQSTPAWVAPSCRLDICSTALVCPDLETAALGALAHVVWHTECGASGMAPGNCRPEFSDPRVFHPIDRFGRRKRSYYLIHAQLTATRVLLPGTLPAIVPMYVRTSPLFIFNCFFGTQRSILLQAVSPRPVHSTPIHSSNSGSNSNSTPIPIPHPHSNSGMAQSDAHGQTARQHPCWHTACLSVACLWVALLPPRFVPAQFRPMFHYR